MVSIQRDNKEKFFVFRSSVGPIESHRLIVEEILSCHSRNEKLNGNNEADGIDEQAVRSSNTSLKLNLGISCGGDLSSIIPNVVAVARKAFQLASGVAKCTNTARTLHTIANGPLSGLSLLYGVNAAMLPHYDSPTQPGQHEEWLCMMSFGNTMIFRCDNETYTIQSGDVMVMDAMATLHGVDSILQDDSMPPICSCIGFPIPQIRLGILLWQGRLMPECTNDVTSGDDDIALDGAVGLFDNDCDD
jgi:hypothetical protein